MTMSNANQPPLERLWRQWADFFRQRRQRGIGAEPLTPEHIDIFAKKAPGVFVLFERRGREKKFLLKYVGKDNNNLNAALKRQLRLVGYRKKQGRKFKLYSRFALLHTNGAQEAYEIACRLYHMYKARPNNRHLHNRCHPAPPPGSIVSCPVAHCPK